MNLLQRLRQINPWHYVWISVLLSELLSIFLACLPGALGWWPVSRELVGAMAVQALVIPALVAPVAIFFIEQQRRRLIEANQALEREIAERRRVEEVLKQSEERYRMIFEKSGDAIFILAGEGPEPGRIVETNQAAADMHGYTIPELCAMTIAQVDTPDSAAKSAGRMAQLLAGQWMKFEVEHYKKDGGAFPLEVTAGAFESGGRRYVMAFDRDITERRQAEEALRDSEEKFRKFADEASFDGIIVHDQGVILDVSQPFASMYGYRREELLGRPALDTVAPGSRELVAAKIALGQEVQYEAEGLRKDGSTFPMEIRAKNLVFRGQTVRTAAVRDITERRQAEVELRHSEERYRSLVEHVPYGLCLFEPTQGHFLFTNGMIGQMTGYSQEELSGLTIWDLLAEEDHERARERMGRRLAGERQVDTTVYTARPKGGGALRIEVSVSVVTYEGRPVLQGFVRDVTQSESVEKQLLRAQKLEALGTLAGGVAHEFNNILMAIRGYTQLLAGRTDLEGKLGDYPRRIEEITKRAANLTSNMLGFARLESGERTLVEANRVLGGMVSLLGQTLPPDIELCLQTQEDLPAVRANISQLEQVLLNLALNAKDAMPQGGTITFGSRLRQAPQDLPGDLAWAEDGAWVELWVADSGQGMSEQVQQRIFEPFFTTKEPGKGTGLGLSVAFSIIKNHGGELLVESQPGRGSRFCIYLPAEEPPAQVAQAAGTEAPLPQGRGQRILVVDDEQSVREISREALEAFGYVVSEAANGQEALEVYAQARQAHQDFDLVILDLSMPVMDGRECLSRLTALNPGARVMMSTGHLDDLAGLSLLAGQLVQVLHKPFDLGALIRAVGQNIGAAPAGAPAQFTDNNLKT